MCLLFALISKFEPCGDAIPVWVYPLSRAETKIKRLNTSIKPFKFGQNLTKKIQQ